MSIRSYATSIANHNRYASNLTLGTLGRLSSRIENKVRRWLRLIPDYIRIEASPLGKKLIKPIQMTTNNGTDLISRSLYYNEWGFEGPLPVLIKSALALCPDGSFIDVGANTGIYAILAKSLYPNRTVCAFEPFPLAIKLMRENISLSGLGSSIFIEEKAAAAGVGTQPFYIPLQDHGLVETSASLISDFKPDHSEVLRVETARLDDCPHRSAAVMKIDVEGAEGTVLRGAINLLKDDRPIVFCEILPGSKYTEEVYDVLKYADYSIASIYNGRIVFGGEMRGDNHILFPMEKYFLLEAIARRAGPQVMPLDNIGVYFRRGDGKLL